ncbi:MAG: phosphate ABC transporter substrate-binding protein [Candidatus Nitrosocaldaceae archaeon]|nr:MAG: phosphate ABC transporter substrate-binding protein [Candidatus Nitrosocaldaceae archaeon]
MNNAVIVGVMIAAVIIGVIIAIFGTTEFSTQSTETVREENVREVSATQLSGSILIDGSSTVYPITEYIAEKFSEVQPDVDVTVAISGTGGGYKRFVIGETDINDASRPIKQKEIDLAAKNNVRYVQIPVALEGLSIVVNLDNNWIQNDCISIEELREIWKPDSNVMKWSDLDPSYPDGDIRLYGAGPDSGTFDYFTERVVGESRASRTDYIPSEDDNVLVQGIASDRYALGYIPLAYVEQSLDRLKLLSVSEEKGGKCVLPKTKTIISGEYPLARPLFITVNYDKLQMKEELKEFIIFYLTNAREAALKVGYVPLPDQYYEDAVIAIKEGRYQPNDLTTFEELYKKYGGI